MIRDVEMDVCGRTPHLNPIFERYISWSLSVLDSEVLKRAIARNRNNNIFNKACHAHKLATCDPNLYFYILKHKDGQ